MDTSETALLITAIAGGLASIIYSFKHVKKSNCCGATCEQAIPDLPRLSRSQSQVVSVEEPQPPENKSIWNYFKTPPKSEPISTEV